MIIDEMTVYKIFVDKMTIDEMVIKDEDEITVDFTK